jgi:hypothetical protein
MKNRQIKSKTSSKSFDLFLLSRSALRRIVEVGGSTHGSGEHVNGGPVVDGGGHEAHGDEDLTAMVPTTAEISPRPLVTQAAVVPCGGSTELPQHAVVVRRQYTSVVHRVQQ